MGGLSSLKLSVSYPFMSSEFPYGIGNLKNFKNSQEVEKYNVTKSQHFRSDYHSFFYLTTKNIPGKSSQEVAKKEVSS